MQKHRVTILNLIFAALMAMSVSAPAVQSSPIPGTAAPASLPEMVDLMDHLPPPGDMGNSNAILGWAISYAMSYRARGHRGVRDPKLIYSPAFIEQELDKVIINDSGFQTALKIVATKGGLSLAEMPYSPDMPKQQLSPEQLERARLQRITSWRKVNFNDHNEIKSLLHAGRPVLIGAHIDEGLIELGRNAVWNQVRGQYLGRAAFVLVGYDNNRKAFQFINCWGETWADQGYGWIGYSFVPKVVFEAFVMEGVRELPSP